MSLLDLAKKTATQSHPNNALIQALKKKMQEAGVVVERVGSSQSIDYVTASVSSDDTTDTPTTTTTTTRPKSTSARSKRSARKRASSYGTVTVKQEDPSAWGSPSADTLPSADILLDSNRATRSGTRTRSCGGAAIKQEDEGENPADLLLHFSRNSDSPSKRFKAATQYAEV